MATFALGLLLGICSLHLFSNPLYGLWVLPLLLLSKKRPWILGLVLGALWMSANMLWHLSHQLPESLVKQPLEIEGTVTSLPLVNQDRASFDFTVSKVLSNHTWPRPGSIRLSWPKAPQKLTVGDQWHLSVKLKRPHGYANPGSFNIERLAFQNRQSATGSVLLHQNNRLINSCWFSKPVDKIRQRLKDIITQNKPESKFVGLLLAMTIGDKSAVTEEQWKVFQATGTAHLMAISGLHIGLVALIGFFLARRLSLGPRGSSGMSLVLAGIYALLAGLSIPTQRAWIMVFAVIIGVLYRRQISPIKVFSAALIAVLLLDPFSSLSIGFWLSFGAVGALLYGLQKENRGWGRSQWVVFVGLLPLSVLGFGQVSLISPLANTLAIPWVSFLVVPFALIGVVLSGISVWLAEPFLFLAEFFLSWLWPILDWCSEFGLVETGPASVFALICAVIGVILLLSPKGIPGKPLSVILFLPLFFPVYPSVNHGEFKMTLLDVGQGLASVIQTQKHTLVFDTGVRYNVRADCGRQVVLPYLKTQGIKKLDMLVLSHLDNDHAGGAKTILKTIPVKQLLLNQLGKYSRYKEQLCQAGQRWQWDGVTFEMLHPSPSYINRKKNNQSCVLKISAGENSVLFTGDIEAHAESFLLLNQKEKLKSNVLIIPHHGSNSSSSVNFIQAVDPDIGLIPVGYCNRYEHPKKNILERYKELGIPLVNTVEGGALSLTISSENVPALSRFR